MLRINLALTIFFAVTVGSLNNVFATTVQENTQHVFDLYPVPGEATKVSSMLSGLIFSDNQSAVSSLKKFVDPYNQFDRIFRIENGNVVGGLSPVPVGAISNDLKKPSKSSALTGLRIAIDPGHMGTRTWDHATGRYVHDDRGNYVSEGTINLITSLLLKKEFEALGATVMLTHENLEAVSSENPTTFDIKGIAAEELRRQSGESWFRKIVSQPNFAAVDRALSNSAQFRRLFSSGMRSEYFISRVDLDARAELINAFHPDLTLVIHYDAPDTPGKDPARLSSHVPNFTRGYVPGAFQLQELNNSDEKADILAELANPERFKESAKVTDSIIGMISTQLNVPRLRQEKNTVPVVPGVLTRNLRVTRQLKWGLVSYLECLMYGSSSEFYRMAETNRSIEIGNQQIFYSNRLEEVASAIRDGVLAYYSRP